MSVVSRPIPLGPVRFAVSYPLVESDSNKRSLHDAHHCVHTKRGPASGDARPLLKYVIEVLIQWDQCITLVLITCQGSKGVANEDNAGENIFFVNSEKVRSNIT